MRGRIDDDLRAGRRPVEMTFAESNSAPLSVLKLVGATPLRLSD